MILVSSGAALGACLRYLLTTIIKTKWQTLFPWATFLINLSGAFFLGLLTGSQHINLFLGTGMLGGYTTFSTLNTEWLALYQSGFKQLALGYLIASYLLGCGLAFLGLVLGAMC